MSPPSLPQLTLEVELVSGVWTDITSRLFHDQADGGQEVSVEIGRQTELDDVEPTKISLALKDADGALTPGNVTSPYWPNWESGRRVRLTETVNGNAIVLATGYLQLPDFAINLPGVDQPVSITAVDLLGKLATAPELQGNLAEYIRANDTGLVEWFPLTDETWPAISAITGSTAAIVARPSNSDAPSVSNEDLAHAATTAGPPGDDQSYPAFDVSILGTGGAFGGWLYLLAPVNIPFASTDAITLSAWIRSGAPTYTTGGLGSSWAAQYIVTLQSADTQLQVLDVWDGTFSFMTLHGFYGDLAYSDLTGYVDAGRRAQDQWQLVTVQYMPGANTVTVWVGADTAVSVSHTAGSTNPFTALRMGGASNNSFRGSVAHVQVRVQAAATAFSQADHIAQHRAGMEGLQRQTVAQRIATLAAYAGVDSSLLDLPDSAFTPMQQAALAGVNPADAMRAAATTGQDTLLTEPTGEITLIPRGQRYNQPVGMLIPYGWLVLGTRYRPDQPISDVRVTRTNGGYTRRRDRTRATRYGSREWSAELDTAVDADVANLADWSLAAYATPRMRCPNLKINMRSQALTDTDRQNLLLLRVGDRIQITGRPADAPEGAGDLIIQGITHRITADERDITFNTSPLLGTTPGSPPVCARVDESYVGDTTLIAY